MKPPFNGSEVWSASINIHEHVVPRWWWVYLVKCDYETTPVQDFLDHDIHYKLHWTQNDTDWNREISLNEQYQNTFHVVIPWLTLSLFIVQCVSYGMYWTKAVPKGDAYARMLALSQT